MGKKIGSTTRAKRSREETEETGVDKQPEPAPTNMDGEAGPSGRPIRVYADGEQLRCNAKCKLVCPGTLTQAPLPFTGIFDMFHFGHARALEQAKKL